MVARIIDTTFDCHDPVRVARFWAFALGYVTDERNAPDVIDISDPEGKGPGLYFVMVPEAKTVKNRLHLDLTTDTSIQDEVDRLVTAGARVESTHRHPQGFHDPYEWTVMQDPEGNEFCVGKLLALQ